MIRSKKRRPDFRRVRNTSLADSATAGRGTPHARLRYTKAPSRRVRRTRPSRRASASSNCDFGAPLPSTRGLA